MQLSTQELLSLFIREGQDWSPDAIQTALKRKGVKVSSLPLSGSNHATGMLVPG
ncbi:TPA: hypothetical protein G9F27_005582 [Salmonella enterica]|uniref:Uncharacterized protein n=1 Tax=Salmonella enterica TaxID=28901 RepID=A0A743PKV3_SALER|nr:hypothetical protein [Salmonella enterica]